MKNIFNEVNKFIYQQLRKGLHMEDTEFVEYFIENHKMLCFKNLMEFILVDIQSNIILRVNKYPITLWYKVEMVKKYYSK